MYMHMLTAVKNTVQLVVTPFLSLDIGDVKGPKN